MNRNVGRRLAALALSFAMCLTLVPAAQAADLPLDLVITSEHMANGQLSKKMKETEQLKVETRGGSSLESGQRAVWESNAPGVAAVDEDGLLTAVSPGEAVITVKAYNSADTQGKTLLGSASCTVTVVQSNVAAIAVYPAGLTLDEGESRDALKATVTMDPVGAEPEAVTWSSDDESVVKVVATAGDNTKAKVTGVAPGQAAVTATAGGESAACTVTVVGLTVTPSKLELVAGNVQSLSVRVYDVGSAGTYVWKSSNDSVARVDANGKVTAVAPGTCTIKVTTEDGKYQATSSVTVKDSTAGVITESVGAGEPLEFADLADEINSQCRRVLGHSLAYVTSLSVPTDQGILHYGYVSVSDTGSGVGTQEKFYYDSDTSSRDLETVTFVPKAGFDGKAVISYTGYDTTGLTFGGEIRVTVEEADDVVYSTGADTPVTFQASDFSTVCRAENGRAVDTVTFTLPASKYGTLYYNYTGSGALSNEVNEKTDYCRLRNPYLDKVTFVPAEGYKGTVRINYEGKDTSGYEFDGKITIYVSGGGGSGSSGDGDINYRSDSGKKVTFSASNFNDLSKDLNEESLEYVKFTLPSSSQGTLYYNYTSSGDYDNKVSASTKYHRTGTPALSKVSFLPKSGFSGTAEVKFTGYDEEGDTFKGVVEIRVRDNGGSNSYEDLEYDLMTDEVLVLDATDFNSACKDETDDALSYIKFTLPSSHEGALYYDYKESNGSYGSKVSSTTRYYRNSSPYLNRIAFVPEAGFSGTVEIEFTGWSTESEKFTGAIEVHVTTPVAKTIRYSTTSLPVAFRASDFNSACDALTGENVKWVKFTAPSSSVGTLYYEYNSRGGSNSQVKSETSYYYAGTPSLDSISFVPKAGYQGTAVIAYTGQDTEGTALSGIVEIQVAAPAPATVFTDMGGYAWASPAVEFLRENGVVSGVSANQYGPSLAITRGDFALMVCRAFHLSQAGSGGFADVPASSYYAGAVETVKTLGIVQGDAQGNYRPKDPVTRQDAAVLLRGAMRVAGWSISDESDTYLGGFQDGGKVAPYARGAVASLVALGIFQGSGGGMLNPASSLTRAEMAVTLHRALTL